MANPGTLTYKLKPIVMARLLAELTVVAILALAPALLLIAGQFMSLEWPLKIILIFLSVIATLIFAGAMQIPWKVAIDDKAITVVAPARKTTIAWEKIERLQLATSWGWRRYLIVHEGGTASFPAWMNNLSALVEQIRSRLPNRGMAIHAGDRIFRVQTVTLSIEFLKSMAGVGLAALLWSFLFSMARTAKNQEDVIIIGIASLIVSLLALGRLFFSLTMPFIVRVEPDGLRLRSSIGGSQLKWQEISSVELPFFALPEGIVLKAGKRRILVPAAIEAFDELEELIKSRKA